MKHLQLCQNVTRMAFAAALGLALPQTVTAATSAPSSDRPNFIIIMADDMGYSDLGSYGSEIETPNIDRLAANGLRFTGFYNTARCCPTRASLLTGLYSHRAGMGRMVSRIDSNPKPGPYQGFLNDSSITIAEALGDAGYRTYMSGKWHVGEKSEHWPRQRGFDRYFGLISGASSYYEIIRNQKRVRQMALDDDLWDPPSEGFYMTDAISDYATQFLRGHHSDNPEDPFLLYVAYTAPHWPLHALPEDIAKYEGRYSQGWDTLRAERYQRMLDMGLIDERYALSDRPSRIPAWEDAENKADWQRRMEVYAAMIDRMDQGIGRILQTLEESGQMDNTLILFLADNGGCAESIVSRALNNPEIPVGERGSFVAYQEPWANASNTPFRLYKQWVHEGGIASPLIAHWPDGLEKPGSMTDQVGHVIDLMPTLLELAGISYPQTWHGHELASLDGKSLAPILAGNNREGHEKLFWEHIGNRAVRQGNWKLVFDGKNAKEWELYNLETDPTEIRNLVSRHPGKVKKLRLIWEEWAENVGVFAER